MKQLELRALTYKVGEKTLFKDLSLKIEPQEPLILMGPSGVGKSSLAHIIAGHLQPQSGEVLLDQVAITGPTRKIIVISQNDDLFPWQTVRDHLAFVGLDEKAIDRHLKLVGLDQDQDLYPRELSGGMKRRLALARGLALAPEVLVIDEAFGSQHEELKNELLPKVIDECKSSQRGLMIITHDLGLAQWPGTRLLNMG